MLKQCIEVLYDLVGEMLGFYQKEFRRKISILKYLSILHSEGKLLLCLFFPVNYVCNVDLPCTESNPTLKRIESIQFYIAICTLSASATGR